MDLSKMTAKDFQAAEQKARLQKQSLAESLGLSAGAGDVGSPTSSTGVLADNSGGAARVMSEASDALSGEFPVDVSTRSGGFDSGLNKNTENHEIPMDELERLGIAQLHGKDKFKAPAYFVKKEKYEHRYIAMLKACCKSNVEIARVTGFSQAAINYLVRQPFMEQMILAEMRASADPALSLLSSATLDAASNLIEVMQKADNLETKRKACNDILDRKYGKPNQPMSIRETSPNEVSDAELVKILDGNLGHAHN